MNRFKRQSKRPIYIGLAVLALLAVVGLVFVNKNRFTNLFNNNEQVSTQDGSPTSSDVNEVNKVNLEPSQPSDNQEINDRKSSADQPTQTVNPTLSATITNTSVADGIARIRILVVGTTSGTCELLLTSTDGSQNITKSAPVKLLGTQYSCDGFDIPLQEFKQSGPWKINTTIVVGNEVSNKAEGELVVP